jgi:hypothetical protein
VLYFKLAVVVLFAVAGYQESRRFAKQYGRSPWGWPPLAWAAVLGLSFLIGLVLIAVAERGGRAASGRVPVPPPAHMLAPMSASALPAAPPTGPPPVSFGSGTTILPKF